MNQNCVLKFYNSTFSNRKWKSFLLLVVISAVLFSCKPTQKTLRHNGYSTKTMVISNKKTNRFSTGADNSEGYFPLLVGKRVGVITNQTGIVSYDSIYTMPDSGGMTHIEAYDRKKIHLVDFLVKNKINLQKIYAPEHGFRGTADAGEHVIDGKDTKTGLPIISLYGENRKPKPEHLEGIDVMIFDIQDVGARFYTFISTLHYVMQACAENKKTVIILDRPNPNGYYIDGPILDTAFKSFVGMHPVPVVHGMTIAEYAQMINGEHWLGDNLWCKIILLKVTGYDHNTLYPLPVKPSPNLPTSQSVYLYPSLCFFEGTDVSVGRGTDKPFQQIGRPNFADGRIKFIPKVIPGISDAPLYKNQICSGFDLTNFCDSYIVTSKRLYLYWLQGFYEKSTDKTKFFNNYFDKLAGTDQLRKQIIAGKSIEEIQKSWDEGLKKYKLMRKKYLLYKDFE